jgi:D-alanine-D-alanine ligase
VTRRRVAVVSGGRSSEHDVSVASARSVKAALVELGAEVVAVEIGRDGAWAVDAGARDDRTLDTAPGPASETLSLARSGGVERLPAPDVTAALGDVDVVFPVLHGPFGEDGTVQGLLELAGVPYVGAGVAASALCMDKDLFKAVMRDRGVPVTRNVTLRDGATAHNPYGYPVFVKPARLGSSVGITKAHDATELHAAVELAFRHDDKVLVEELVEGVEVEVGVLGNRRPEASLPGEIVVTGREWYDFAAKYDEGGMELVVPARISDEAARAAQELAVEAFVASDCEGMARVDLFVRGDGRVLVNELNTIPGFPSTSVYTRLFEASGLPYARLLERLIELALERHERRRSLRY